jgi:hypothetical protein
MWKEGGHKEDCQIMKGTARPKAKKAVACLLDTSSPLSLRAEGLLWSLDSEGYYMCAVEAGLHRALLAVLYEDLETLQNGGCIKNLSLCHCIMPSLFREAFICRDGTRLFRKADGGRIKAFVESDPKAFQVWWKVAIKIAALPFRREVYGSPLYTLMHAQARDIWAGFWILLTDDRPSRAVLLTDDKEKCKKRAEWMLTQQKATLKALWGAPEGFDRGLLSIEASLSACSAMIAYRCREVGVNLKVEKILGMNGIQKARYRKHIVPLAKRTIER